MGKPRMKNEMQKPISEVVVDCGINEDIKQDIWNLFFNRLWSIDQIAQKYKRSLTYHQVRTIIFERLK